MPIILYSFFLSRADLNYTGFKAFFELWILNVPVGLYFLYRGFKEDFWVYIFIYLPLLFILVIVYELLFILSLLVISKIFAF